MSSNESLEIRTMRHMAWERAKGELRSMLTTFWGDGSPGLSDEYTKLNHEVEMFIKHVEDEGLHE